MAAPRPGRPRRVPEAPVAVPTYGPRLARRVRGLRLRRGLSDYAAAERAGCSRGTLQRVEWGQGDAVTLRQLAAIAAALGVPLVALLRDCAAEPEPEDLEELMAMVEEEEEEDDQAAGS